MNTPMTKFAIMRANREKQRQIVPAAVPARIPAHQYWNMLIGPGHPDLPKTFTDGGRHTSAQQPKAAWRGFVVGGDGRITEETQ